MVDVTISTSWTIPNFNAMLQAVGLSAAQIYALSYKEGAERRIKVEPGTKII